MKCSQYLYIFYVCGEQNKNCSQYTNIINESNSKN